MPEPRLSVLIVAKNEAKNLADCLASASWADRARRDRRRGEPRRHRRDRPARGRRGAVREFDDFARQRNAALAMATGDWVLSIDADERVPPALAAEIRRVISDPATRYRGYRVPIAERDPGPPIRLLGDAARPSACGYSAGIPGDGSGWFMRRSSSTGRRGRSGMRWATTRSRAPRFSSTSSTTTRRWKPRAWRVQAVGFGPAMSRFGRSGRSSSYMSSSRGFAMALKVSCSVHFPGVSVAVRAWKHRELTLVGRAS